MKGKGNKEVMDKQNTNSNGIDLNPIKSINTLNLGTLNHPTRRQMMSDYMTNDDSITCCL